MDLFLRKVIDAQAHDNYRVILKDDGMEIEVGSIGVSARRVGLGYRQHRPNDRSGNGRCRQRSKRLHEAIPRRLGQVQRGPYPAE